MSPLNTTLTNKTVTVRQNDYLIWFLHLPNIRYKLKCNQGLSLSGDIKSKEFINLIII